MSGLADTSAGPGKLVVISGPSGVGKSSIVREVLDRTGATYSVSLTTRPPRPGEVDGVHYRFVDRATFEEYIAQDQLLEWAEVFGHYYGTPAAPVREAITDGRAIILEIDVQGGVQVHDKMADASFVLIVPPDDQTLAERLAGRGTEDEATVARRLGKARAELDLARSSGAYDIEIVNDDLDRAIGQVVAIVQER
jgi:guanylate kinase